MKNTYEEKTAKIGDMIVCQGRKAIISEIIYQQYSYDKYWMIEGRDQNGDYFMWKQRFDGGHLITAEALEERRKEHD